MERTARRDAAHALRTGAAHEAHEERFELILGVMGGRDEVEARVEREAGKRLVPPHAGDLLDVRAQTLRTLARRIRHVVNGHFRLDERNAEQSRQGSHGVAIDVRFRRWAHVVNNVG